MDDDGYFVYVGRKDDVIKASGYRIGPYEVEDVLSRHPAVKEAGVIGVADRERGSRVVAYVVLRENAAPSETLVEDLQALVRKDCSVFAYPREVIFTDKLPRSAPGKIDRASLRRKYALSEPAPVK